VRAYHSYRRLNNEFRDVIIILNPVDEEKENEFSNLIKKHGPKKAAEIIRGTGAIYDDDFTKSHKKHPTFTNKATAELIEQIENISQEVELGTGNGDVYEDQKSSFVLHTQETEAIIRKQIFAE